MVESSRLASGLIINTVSLKLICDQSIGCDPVTSFLTTTLPGASSVDSSIGSENTTFNSVSIATFVALFVGIQLLITTVGGVRSALSIPSSIIIGLKYGLTNVRSYTPKGPEGETNFICITPSNEDIGNSVVPKYIFVSGVNP